MIVWASAGAAGATDRTKMASAARIRCMLPLNNAGRSTIGLVTASSPEAALKNSESHRVYTAAHAATCRIRGHPGGDGGHGALGHGPSRLRHVLDERGRQDHGHRHGPRFRQSAFVVVSGRHS